MSKKSWSCPVHSEVGHLIEKYQYLTPEKLLSYSHIALMCFSPTKRNKMSTARQLRVDVFLSPFGDSSAASSCLLVPRFWYPLVIYSDIVEHIYHIYIIYTIHYHPLTIHYPLVMTNIAIVKMVIYVVDFPIEHGWMFQFAM